MAHVAGTKRLVNGLRISDRQAARRQQIPDEDEEATERGRFPDADVVDLIDSPRRGERCEQVGLGDVLDVAEVAAGPAVPADDARLAPPERGDPTGEPRP